MKFPYGISDFYKISSNDYFYIDRTDKLYFIEQGGDHLLFLRPRRFGKSLLLSMLENYYDLAKADEFAALFGHLAIGKNPTPKHNQYFILNWDFSVISPVGKPEEIKQNLYDHINGRIENCAVLYGNWLPSKVNINTNNALESLQSLLTAVQQTPYKLYLLIDEYDNIANEIMMLGQENSEERYKSLLYGEGIFKTIFKTLKSLSSGRGLDKVFICGVSPVMMTDVTSGYNIARDIYLESELNDLCGFHEAEIKSTLEQISSECDLPNDKADEALTMMKQFYNGYAFSYEQKPTIYNPTLALYFMDHFQKHCDYPRDLLDSNLAMDRNKIQYIAQLPKGKSFIQDVLNKESPMIVEKLSRRFGLQDMITEHKDRAFMGSLLYYLGVLTMQGNVETGDLQLIIPNLVVRKLYIEQIQRILLPDINRDEALQTAKLLYTKGDMQPLCDFVEQSYFTIFDNRDYRWSNELTIKTVFLSLLFNDTFYIMESETSLDRGYADLIMIIRPDMRKYQLLDILIEFKYLSLKEVALSGSDLRALSRDELKALSPVQTKLSESGTKLKDYVQSLKKNYGSDLRLHSYSLVSIGFDKLIWQEIK